MTLPRPDVHVQATSGTLTKADTSWGHPVRKSCSGVMFQSAAKMKGSWNWRRKAPTRFRMERLASDGPWEVGNPQKNRKTLSAPRHEENMRIGRLD
eukprot:14255255-Alexandrium_andersonii.AAC.1